MDVFGETMNRLTFAIILAAIGFINRPLHGAGPVELKWDVYPGYSVSNTLPGSHGAEWFFVIKDQKVFDAIFVVLPSKEGKQRLPQNALKSRIVLGVEKRGNAVWQFKVDRATENNGLVRIFYSATSRPGADNSISASLLIVSIPKVNFKVVQFVENGKTVSGGRYRIYFATWDRIFFDVPSISEGEFAEVCDKVKASAVISRFKNEMLPAADVTFKKGVNAPTAALMDEVQAWLISQGMTDIKFRQARSSSEPPILREYRDGKVTDYPERYLEDKAGLKR